MFLSIPALHTTIKLFTVPHIFPRLLVNKLLYLPECREILWYSYGSAAGYGGYGGGGYGGGGGGYGEI